MCDYPKNSDFSQIWQLDVMMLLTAQFLMCQLKMEKIGFFTFKKDHV